jgi:hypothetical protein
MNISKYDIGIFISMSIVVIFMSFTFPAMGLAGDNANVSDVPQFNISSDQFEFRNDFPDRVNAPSHGWFNHTSDQYDSYKGQIQYNFGPGLSGNGDVYLAVPVEDEIVASNETQQKNVTFSSNDNTKELVFDGFTFEIHSENVSTGVYEFYVTSRPSDKGWLAGIPIVSDIVGAGEALAGTLAWGFSVIWFFVVAWFELTLGTLATILKTAVFFISMAAWLVTTYMDIVNAAPSGWISVFILIPAIAVFSTFAKMVAALIEVVWI